MTASRIATIAALFVVTPALALIKPNTIDRAAAVELESVAAKKKCRRGYIWDEDLKRCIRLRRGSF